MAVKTLAIVQARMGSTRLPGKVLKEVNGKPLIEILLHRLSQSKMIDKIVLATGENSANDVLAEKVEGLAYAVFRGSEEDVLDRYYQAAKLHNPETVVRITGDCPIIDPVVVGKVIKLYEENEADYACNTDPPTYPDGLDTEVFSFHALEIAQKHATTVHEREHVTPLIRNSEQFRRFNLTGEADHSGERWTVDEPEDFQIIEQILKYFAPNMDFTWEQVLEMKQTNPELFEANLGIRRNEGADLGTGQKLYKRAKKLIPGG